METATKFVEANSRAFALVGVGFCSVVCMKAILLVFRAIRSFFLAPLLNLGTNPAKLGSWGVVTGATDGIGELWRTVTQTKPAIVLVVQYVVVIVYLYYEYYFFMRNT